LCILFYVALLSSALLSSAASLSLSLAFAGRCVGKWLKCHATLSIGQLGIYKCNL